MNALALALAAVLLGQVADEEERKKAQGIADAYTEGHAAP
jgi:hypothetical protein